MRVLVCGSRGFDDYKCVYRYLATLSVGHEGEEIVIIHGAARGADTLAGMVGSRLGYVVEPYPANWAQHGKSAGIKRNQQMLDEGHPEVCIAFYRGVYPTPGTADMIERARKANLVVLTPMCTDDPL